MPGYHREAARHLAHWSSLTDSGIVYVVCLAGAQESSMKAPDYQEFLDGTAIGERWIEFRIPDRSVPADQSAFLVLLNRLSGLLQSSVAVVVIHCAAGVGRTGMVAASLLVRMGLTSAHALALVRGAGSEPETRPQRKLVELVPGEV